MNLALILKFVFKNFWYKLASIILAVVIWSIVQGEEIVEINQRIRMEVSVGPNYLVKGGSYHFIDAQVKGPRVLVGEGNLKPIEARYLVNPGEVGRLEIPFDTKYIKGGWDNRIKIFLRNPYFSVIVDEKATRSIPVREILRGTPNEGYIIEKTTVSPQNIKVTWLKSELKNLTEIVTEPIDVTDLQKTKTIEALLIPKDIPDEALETNIVKVHLSLGEVRINRTYKKVVVELANHSGTASISPSTITMTLQGKTSSFDAADGNGPSAFVDLANLSSGTFVRPVLVKIPKDTALIEIKPDKVRVELKTQDPPSKPQPEGNIKQEGSNSPSLLNQNPSLGEKLK